LGALFLGFGADVLRAAGFWTFADDFLALGFRARALGFAMTGDLLRGAART
jgi:hypothetical protein